MRRRLSSSAPLFAAALAVTACYQYDHAPVSAVVPDRLVELALTDSGAVVLAAKIGPRVESLRGRVLADSAGTLTLAMTETRQRSGNEQDWRGEQLEVPHALVASLGERRFSLARTLVVSAGVVGVLVGVSAAFNGPGFGSGNGSGPQCCKQ